MSEVPLAHKYSAETYDQALSNLVERWKREDGEGPIKYDEAAIGMDKSTVSVALKFLGEIGLLDVPKAGNYNVPEDVIDYRTKVGEVQREAKQKVEDRISNYALYSESTFYLNVNDFTIDELVTEVAGSSEVAASQDEINDVERSLRVLAELDFLEIDDEGNVSVPDDQDLNDDSAKTSAEKSGQDSDENIQQETKDHQLVEFNGGQEEQDEAAVEVNSQIPSESSILVDVDVSMDVTEMETNEVQEKLQIIRDTLR